MSFLDYLMDKRYFLLLYAVLMSFITVILFVSGEGMKDLIGYVNLVGLSLAGIYLIAGYRFHAGFYRELTAMAEQDVLDMSVAERRGLTNGQALCVKLIEKRQQKLEARLEKLKDEKQEHQDFILSWIHEVKTPISAGRLLLEGSLGMSGGELEDKLEVELDKIEAYVEQALYYSRIDSFSKDYFIEEVELGALVRECVKKHAKLFIGKGIQFQMKERKVFVHSDSKWLAYILNQLLANALKYTEGQGLVKCTFEEDQREKRLLIEDSGAGIKAEELHRVFEKGFTGSNGRMQAKSTGIGLYLAKQLAQKLSHDLTLESEEGRYTRAVIHFPKIRSYYEL